MSCKCLLRKRDAGFSTGLPPGFPQSLWKTHDRCVAMLSTMMKTSS